MKWRKSGMSAAITAIICLAVVDTLVKCDPPFLVPSWIDAQTNIQYTQNGPPQFLDMYSRKGSNTVEPVIVAIHGGGWSSGKRQSFAHSAVNFVKEGYVFCTIDYRLDDEATYPAQVEDCKCAIRFLRAKAAKYHIDPARIGVWGGSAGGHLVAMLGTSGGVKRLEGDGGWENQSSAVQAVLDWFGPSDLRAAAVAGYRPQSLLAIQKLLGGSPSEKPELASDASPVVFVAPGDPPFLIMHGDRDPTVPLAQSQELYDALKAAGVNVALKIVPDAGHGGPGFTSPENISLINNFFRNILHPTPQPPGTP